MYICYVIQVAAPQAGGLTVFPDLGVRLWPQKVPNFYSLSDLPLQTHKQQ